MNHTQSLFIFVLPVLVAACASVPPSQMDHSKMNHSLQMNGKDSVPLNEEHEMVMEKGNRNLTVREERIAPPTALAFSIHEDEGTFADYGVSHTKEMHLIVVRDDLQHFRHMHPSRNSEGIWKIDFQPDDGGKYWIYADFVDTQHGAYTLRYERTYPEPLGQYGLVKDYSATKVVQGYRFHMTPSFINNTVSFAYDITDHAGLPVDLEDYLGAKGHSILFSTSGGFTHAHAAGNPPVFEATVERGTFYRMYTQFQIKGKFETVAFDWQAS